ncbi:MAG: hypothetical protein NTX50_16010, partial [Candidatus Sumerlaeota bacterium]|nr:hypothetical protein [Candidatus Sumerlaeota bacterium]
MIRIATSIIGALLLAAGICIIIVFGNILDVLAGQESASFGGFDLAGGIMAIAGLLMVAVIAASKSSAILNIVLSQTLYSLL